MPSHSQQVQHLLPQQDHHMPHTAFLKDLDHHLQTLSHYGHLFVLGGDFNESLKASNSHFIPILAWHHFVDFIGLSHKVPRPASYICSRCHINYILFFPYLLHMLWLQACSLLCCTYPLTTEACTST